MIIMVDDVQLGCVRHLHHCVRRTATRDVNVVGLIWFDSCFRCVLVGNIGTRCERMRATLAVINMQLRCMVELL